MIDLIRATRDRLTLAEFNYAILNATYGIPNARESAKRFTA